MVHLLIQVLLLLLKCINFRLWNVTLSITLGLIIIVVVVRVEIIIRPSLHTSCLRLLPSWGVFWLNLEELGWGTNSITEAPCFCMENVFLSFDVLHLYVFEIVLGRCWLFNVTCSTDWVGMLMMHFNIGWRDNVAPARGSLLSV